MPSSLTNAFRCIALLASVTFAGCASLDKYSFETFVKPPAGDRRFTSAEWPERSDARALLYADYQARLLEGRGTGARVVRETSDSTLVVGGALVGAQETLGIAAGTVARMGVGGVVIRELQGVFNARGRSEAFVDAAYLIRQAMNEYRQYNPNPSPTQLTENGAILISRVDAAMHAARKSLNGRLPGLLDLQQATQRMTKAGATRQSSGVPQTIFTAAGDKPGDKPAGPTGATPEQVNAAVNRAVQDMKREQVRLVKEQISQPLTPTEAQAKIDSMTAELSGTVELARVQKFHRDIIGEPQETDIDILKNTLNEKLRATRTKAVSTDAAEKETALKEVKQYLKVFGR